MAVAGFKTLAAGLAGALVGFFVGGPQGALIGFSLGASLGAGFEEKPGVEQGRISDTTITGANYGDPIPRGFGTVMSRGIMVWTSGLIEKKDKSKEGGGLFSTGTEVTTFKYFLDVAYLIAEGPIQGVARIWFNGELLYDGSTGASALDLATNGKYWDELIVYKGDESQDPSPLIESYEGAGQVSAMRGIAYFTIKKMRLKRFFNKAPEVKIEFVRDSSTSSAPSIVDALTTEVVDREAAIYEGGTVLVSDINTSGLDIKDQFDHEFSRLDLEGNVLDAWTYEIREPNTSSSGQIGQCRNDPFVAIHANITEPGTNCKLYYDGEKIGTLEYPTSQDNGPLGTADYQAYRTGTAGEETIKRGNGQYYFAVVGTYSSNTPGIVRYVADSFGRPTFTWDLAVARTDLIPGYPASSNLSIHPDAEDENILWIYSSDTTYRLMRADLDLNILQSWTAAVFGSLGGQEDDPILIGPGYVLYKTAHTTATATLKTFDHETSNSTVTSATVVIDNTTNYSGVLPIGNNLVMTKYEIVTREALVARGTQTLQSVVETLLDDQGYSAGEYDMSGLTGNVRGFLLSGPTGGREALNQLMLTHYFDLVEIDKQVVGVMRGGASVATIPAADLAARAVDARTPDQVTRDRADEFELPRSVTFRYQNSDGNYETGSQAATRQVTGANKDAVLSTGVVMTDDEAMRAAHVNLYDEHAKAERLSFSLTEKYSELVPSDLVTIPDGADSRLVRIVEMSENLRGILELIAVPEFPAIYTQNMAGAPTSASYADAVSQNGPARLGWFDMPMLIDNDDNLGVYAGASGYLAGWTSHELYKFLDALSDYGRIGSFVDNARIGTAEDALADWTSGVVDWTNTVTIRLANSANTLASSTEALVVADKAINRAVLGQAGRWEVLQFVTATALGSGRYTLSGLLRGRRGTNYAVDEHAVGDVFALLDNTEIERLAYDASEVGSAIVHKFVGRDDVLELVTPTRLEFTGRAKLPFAPARVEAALSGSDWIIDWDPRTRFDGAIWSNQAYADDPEVESYTIDFLNGSGVVQDSQSVTVGTETFTWTLAMQNASGFGAPQTDIIVAVYQKGATLATEGHGYQITTATDARAIVDPKT